MTTITTAAKISDKWIELENKYNIRIFNKDGNGFRPIDEWLDDLYIQCPSRCLEMLEEIMLNGDELFAHLTEHKQ